MPRIPAGQRLTVRELEDEISREVKTLKGELAGQTVHQRCRVCQHPESLERVNQLLSYGMDVTEVLELVGDINTRRAKNSKITYRSILYHRNKHFNLQKPVAAAYRRILERRAAQRAEVYGEQVGRLLTGMGFLDIVAHKGFEALMDGTSEVTHMEGLNAILKLEEIQRQHADDIDTAEQRRRVTLLYEAVRDIVPERYWSEISRRLADADGGGTAVVVAEQVTAREPEPADDDGFDPVIDLDADDDLPEG